MGAPTETPQQADPFAPLVRTPHGEDYSPTCYLAVRRALARGKWFGPAEEHPEFEELLAAAAAALPRAAHGYRVGHASGAKPSTFALTCAHNAAVDHLRRIGRAYRTLDPMDPMAFPVLGGQAADPDSLGERTGFSPVSEDGWGIARGDWQRAGHSTGELVALIGPPIHAAKHGPAVLREVARLQASGEWPSADRAYEGNRDRRGRKATVHSWTAA